MSRRDGDFGTGDRVGSRKGGVSRTAVLSESSLRTFTRE